MTSRDDSEESATTFITTPWAAWWRTFRRPLTVVFTVAAVIGFLIFAGGNDYSRPPEQNIPAWLHITAADLAQNTLVTQISVATIILLASSLAVVLAVHRLFARAATLLLGAAGFTATAVFVLPGITVGEGEAHVAGPPGSSADPVPFPTDLDYHAYLPHLLDAVTKPALWSLAAAIPLGLALAAAGIRLPDLRRHPERTSAP